MLIAVSIFGMSPVPKQQARDRLVIVHLEGVFSAKVSLMPFSGTKAAYSNPVAEAPDVKNGQSATLKIPAAYLPGEFLLRLDYRTKETDSPYPSERIIYINKQDIEITVDPPYINNDDKTKFNAGETENTVYSAFMKENSAKRMPLDLLQQFLLSYDRLKSELYTQAADEFQQRRTEYNAWLSEQAKKYSDLYVSRLFQFQHIPKTVWSGDEKERLNQILKNYFDGINFSDPIVIQSYQLYRFMDSYMRLYGMQATTEKQRSELFTQAGSVACEKASHGDPKFYGWMVDYFYNGYESTNIAEGMLMLKKHIDNPNCLTSKRQQISQRLEGIKRLTPGALAPDFAISDNQGNNFQFHKWIPKTKYKLLLFWSVSCASCQQLAEELKQWYNEPANRKKLDIVAVSLEETEAGTQRWKEEIVNFAQWKHLHAQGGVNSPPARDYAILSTPVMFLIGSQNNVIVSVPGNLDQLIKDLK